MSTRWYPIYQRGNPQLRVFLPNFWLKLVKHDNHKQPSNVVQFITSIEMTKYDIKNYLEKIYAIPVVSVRTRIVMGKTKTDKQKGYVTKNDDYKLAYVTMGKGTTLKFPKFERDEERERKRQASPSRHTSSRFKWRCKCSGWYHPECIGIREEELGSLQENEWRCEECAEGKGLVVVVGNKLTVEKKTQVSGEGGNWIWDMLSGSFVEGVPVPVPRMEVAKEEI
ncbi:hypothetical protein PR048_027692 [Dryococelus australis]|uniref:Large ribosomal subunit protein uL23m n=1 Tax=Dryococelus australis TaxID=614101 RepID=A0ABQ9GH88_9NEOP|nr:hypothetical protein PR048_027692 [Dryococelus australis]